MTPSRFSVLYISVYSDRLHPVVEWRKANHPSFFTTRCSPQCGAQHASYQLRSRADPYTHDAHGPGPQDPGGVPTGEGAGCGAPAGRRPRRRCCEYSINLYIYIQVISPQLCSPHLGSTQRYSLRLCSPPSHRCAQHFIYHFTSITSHITHITSCCSACYLSHHAEAVAAGP